jgi:hypothetical protein
MATVLEQYTTEEQRSVASFSSAKGLRAKDIHKEIFHVYGGKCLSRKAFHSWVKQRDERFADDEEVETEVRKWLRQQSKRLLCCRFRRTGKAMGQVYQRWCRISREILVNPFVIYLLTLPRSRWSIQRN